MSSQIPEYSSFETLANEHVEGRDFYRVIKPLNRARVAIIAPHGGRIEPKTHIIASELAGEDFSLYCFISCLPTDKANLHITSHRFDDPACLALLASHTHVVAVHGWAKHGEAILIGGLDTNLANQLAAESRNLGVETHTDGEGLAGTHRLNICNRGRTGLGVQLELTMELRKSRKLQYLLSAFRAVLIKYQNAA